MTEAVVERVEPDPWGARSFITRAKALLTDGGDEGLAPESRQILLHSATIATCDAVLAVNGRQVRGVEGGHQLRIAAIQPLLTTASEELFERLDEARATRNDVSYAAGFVFESSV